MAKRIFFISFSIMFLSFLVLYIVGTTGYFDYKRYERMVITKEQMTEFEKDVSEGKDVSLTDYINSDEFDYNNSVSNMGFSLSSGISKYTKLLLGGMFSAIDKVIK